MTQSVSPFTNPIPPGSGGPAPRTKDLEGCLVAYAPLRIDLDQPGYKNGPAADRVTADVYLLETANGAPIAIGGNDEGAPHTHTIVGPAKFPACWINSSQIVNALAPGRQALVGQFVLCRVQRGTQGNRPWLAMAVSGTPDEAKAIGIWSQIQLGALRYNEPQPIAGVPQAPAQGVVQYAPPPQAAPPATPAPQVDAYQQWLATQQPATPPPPVGWQPAAWASLTDAQRAQVLASIGQ